MTPELFFKNCLVSLLYRSVNNFPYLTAEATLKRNLNYVAGGH